MELLKQTLIPFPPFFLAFDWWETLELLAYILSLSSGKFYRIKLADVCDPVCSEGFFCTAEVICKWNQTSDLDKRKLCNRTDRSDNCPEVTHATVI